MRDSLRRALARIEHLSASPSALRGLLLLVSLLYGSTLLQGFQVDDLWHRVLLRGASHLDAPTSPWWNLFVFFDGDVARFEQFRSRGFVAWWGDPSIRVAFFRPLSGLTHALDHALWPRSPGVMHLHSVLWYLGLCGAAAALYRQLASTRVAAIAALIYAIDHNHGGVVGWIANRNAIVAALFGLLAVLSHHRGARWTSAGALALALLAGESGLATVGYLAAYALTLDARPWRERARSLVPSLIVVLGWAAVYRLGHYGTLGSGMYLDPGHNPLRYLAGVPRAMTLLAASEWGGIAPEVCLALPLSARPVILAVAIVAVALSLLGLAQSLRTRPVARFFLLGAALSMLPACGTVAATRLLLLPGFGLLGAVAEALCALVEVPASRPLLQRAGLLWLGAWAGLGHLLLSPILVVPLSWQMAALHGVAEEWADSFARDDRALSEQRLIVVNAPDTTFLGYLQLIRDYRGDTTARSIFALAAGTHPLTLTRDSRNSVVVEAPGGFYQRDTELLTRDLHLPMPPGTRVVVPDIAVDVLRTTAGGVPDVARFVFAGGLDDPRYRWTEWRGHRLVTFALPAVGARVSYEGRRVGQ